MIPTSHQEIRGDTPEFPSIAEQDTYWKRREHESLEKVKLLAAVDAMGVFLGQLNDAIAHFRKEMERLTKQ